MNFETMQMDKGEARKRYIEYRKSVRQHRDERRRKAEQDEVQARAKRSQIEREEDDLRAAYRAMSLGQRVLNLPSAIRAAGFDEQGRPKLAFARSHWEWCLFNASSDSLKFKPDRFSDRKRIEFAMRLFGKERFASGKALVPPVPPRFRPVDLENYHTLWEAEWLPVPPHDPLLLKQIGTTLFIVCAQWELTAIERAVLEGRFR